MSENLTTSLNKEFNLNNKLWYEWKKCDLISETDDYFENVFYYDLSGTFKSSDGLLDYPKQQLLLLGKPSATCILQDD